MATPIPTSGAEAVRSPSWRKRHPVAARLLLYGAGLLLAGLAFWLLAGRKEQDRQDKVAYLWSRLESLPVVLPADPEGPEVLRVLDQEYADPALPADLRARAERLRGIVARNRKDRAGVDAAFGRAVALDPAAAAVAQLEWALCLADLKDGAAARAKLPANPAAAGWGWAGTLWAVLVTAQADALAGSADGAREALGLALDRLPRPLPRERPFWFGLGAWQPSGAALEATRWLMLDPSFAASPRARTAWLRMGELAAGDAEALLACAEALLGLGEEAAARQALDGALAADRALVTKALESRPGLAALLGR